MVNVADNAKAYLQANYRQTSGQVGGKNQLTLTAQQKKNDELGLKKTESKMMQNDIMSKTRIKVQQASMVPGYIARGVKGDPESNFFEFLKIAKIPYYVGGPMLAWCFASGGRGSRAHQTLVGAALYYLAPVVADFAVTTPLRIFRGVDMNHPSRVVIEGRKGYSQWRQEYHKIFESADFTRWDLMYNADGKAMSNPALVNERFAKIAKKVGIDENLNSPDSAVKPYGKKMIVQTRAWKTLLMAPLVVIGLGIASNPVWKESSPSSLWKSVKGGFTGEAHNSNAVKNVLSRVKTLVHDLWGDIDNTFGTSIRDLWKGSKSGLGKYYGKVAIVSAAAMVIIANINILSTSSAKKKRVVDAAIINNVSQKLRNVSLMNPIKANSAGLGGKKNG